MKFVVIKSSDYSKSETKEFLTLEGLLDWVNEQQHPVIISREQLSDDFRYELEIYDGYRE